MGSQYPDFNLRMTNLMIAMCRGEPTVPSLLRDLGYGDRAVELRFAAGEGDVKPELRNVSTVLRQ